jgi:hypothetical protein
MMKICHKKNLVWLHHKIEKKPWTWLRNLNVKWIFGEQPRDNIIMQKSWNIIKLYNLISWFEYKMNLMKNNKLEKI